MALFKKKEESVENKLVKKEEAHTELEKECAEAVAEIKPKGGLLQKVAGKLMSAETHDKIARAALLCSLLINYKKGKYTVAPTNTVKAVAGAICSIIPPLKSKKILALVGFDMDECKSIWAECGHLIEKDLVDYRQWQDEQKNKVEIEEAIELKESVAVEE